jgi:tetratricopeptide (TPR) repeat protein
MGPIVLFMALAMASMAADKDALSRARELYNLHQYDSAIQAAEEARRIPGTVDTATLILGRAYLERFRSGHDAMDLTQARAALMGVDPSRLSPQDSVELVIGLGETLYFDGQFGAAAELFDVALAAPRRIEGSARDGLVDWWADSLDRHAATGPSRGSVYARMLRRMEEEAQRDSRSTAAPYWLVVAAHGLGDLDRAWNAAIAAWVKAPHVQARAAQLRADLDRYVTQVVIPERAKQSPPAEESARTDILRAEWEAIKHQWGGP